MNIPPHPRMIFSSLRRTRGIHRRIVHVCLSSILLLNAAACHNSNPGPHTRMGSQAVEVVATLLGAAAEIGVLALTKNHLAAIATSGVVGAGATYVIDEIGLTCKACGTASPYPKQPAIDSEPRILSCSNPACHRFAYLVVSNAQDRLESILQSLKANLPPTCLLMKEITLENQISLRWVSHNATDATLDGEAVGPNGSNSVYPDHTTTYVLKVIGVNGRSEDSVTVEVAEPLETEPDDDTPIVIAPPPPPPPEPPVSPSPISPTTISTRVSLDLDKIEVNEDGSMGGTDWSFEIVLNGIGAITIPRRSYHDDGRRLVQFGKQTVNAVVPGNEVNLQIGGYNFDGNRRAEGTLRMPVDMLSGTTQKIHVTVPENYKKGYFIVYVTITKQN